MCGVCTSAQLVVVPYGLAYLAPLHSATCRLHQVTAQITLWCMGAQTNQYAVSVHRELSHFFGLYNPRFGVWHQLVARHQLKRKQQQLVRR